MIALLMLAEAVAKPVTVYRNGNQLYTDCQGGTDVDGQIGEIACLNYVQGVVDAAQLMQRLQGAKHLFCPPPQVVGGQLKDITTNYLRAHPEQRQHVGAGLVLLAMKEAYPCSE